MSDVTDADGVVAEKLVDLAMQAAYDEQFVPKEGDVSSDDVVQAIAAALAEERRKAREPFLALADELDEEAPLQEVWDGNEQGAYLKIAKWIRAAAEENGE